MPQIKLSIDITIQNYPEIAERKAGPAAGLMASNPLASKMIEAKVDAEVLKRVQATLGPEISQRIQAELSEHGVKADVLLAFMA